MDNNIYSTILVNFRSKTKQLPINIFFCSIRFISFRFSRLSICYFHSICVSSKIEEKSETITIISINRNLFAFVYCRKSIAYCDLVPMLNWVNTIFVFFFFGEIIMRKIQWHFQFPSKSLLSLILKKNKERGKAEDERQLTVDSV